MRWAREGTGKSGGVRVIYFNRLESGVIYLMVIYAKAVRGKWVSESGQGVGERDYAPGYAQLLEGDLIFGDPDTDPDSRALHALLQDAQAIHGLILLGDGDASPANASEEAA